LQKFATRNLHGLLCRLSAVPFIFCFYKVWPSLEIAVSVS
jgi:hypothetical protein